MSDEVGNPEDLFSHVAAHFTTVLHVHTGKVCQHLDIDLREKQEVVSQMPQLNKAIPSDDWSLPPVPDWSHLQYLQVSRRPLRNLAHAIYEPVHEKTNNLGSPPGLTQTGLYSHRRRLES